MPRLHGRGNAYDSAVDARDLVFTYRTGSGQIFAGSVQFVP